VFAKEADSLDGAAFTLVVALDNPALSTDVGDSSSCSGSSAESSFDIEPPLAPAAPETDVDESEASFDSRVGSTTICTPTTFWPVSSELRGTKAARPTAQHSAAHQIQILGPSAPFGRANASLWQHGHVAFHERIF
jgi:hypothetical protein